MKKKTCSSCGNKKQNILIISPKVPDRNMSAGDYRVYHITKQLSEYYNIYFTALNSKNSDKKLKKSLLKFIKQFLPPVKNTGDFKSYIKKYNISLCIYERYFSMPFELCRFMPYAKTVVDVHEIGFEKSRAMSKITNIENLNLFKAKELLFYKNAEILICISDREKQILKKYFPDKKIFVVPTCTEIKNTARTFEQRKDICFFGFFGHTPNTDAINYFCSEIMPEINKKLPDIKFNIIGNNASVFKNKYKNTVVKENIKNIPEELSKYKLFVCPLRYGAGLKKKTLDAMAAKLPVVSTKFGVEGIKNLHNKYAKTKKEFIKQIVKLYTDKKLWQTVSETNFNIVKKYYSEEIFNKNIGKFSDFIGTDI